MNKKRKTLTINTRKKAKKVNLFLSRINKNTETKAKRKKSPAFAISIQPGVTGVNLLLISKNNPDINTITPTFRATSVTDLIVSDPLMGCDLGVKIT